MHEQRVILELARDLPGQVSDKRLAHIRRVAGFSRALARRFGQDPDKARIAAYAHDFAREWPPERLLAFCVQHGLELTDMEKEKPVLLHGKVASVLLQRNFGYCQQEVIEAIECHTMGRAGMGPLARILFVADYAEPGRKYIDREWRRHLKASGLEEMVSMVIRHSMIRHGECHPLTAGLLREVEGGWLNRIVSFMQRKGRVEEPDA